MRLGAYPCALKDGSKAREIYGKALISERHRHRFEVNNEFRAKLEAAGLIFSGTSPDDTLAEMIELRDHPWFIGVQFHPEFQSNPRIPHPLFKSFVAAALASRLSDDRLTKKVEKHSTTQKTKGTPPLSADKAATETTTGN